MGRGLPPPLFGQCPKENIFFSRRASLRLDIEEDEENDDNDERRTTKNLVASELEEALRITEDLARKARKVAGKHDIVE